jgi:hypothetical protein
MPPLLGTRNLTFLAVVATFATLALPSASALTTDADAKVVRACARTTTGNLRLPRRPRCRRGERPVSWGLIGPRGPQGPKGEVGAAGPAGAGHPSIFSAQAAAYAGALSPAFAAVTGITQVTSTESQAQTLAPAANFNAHNLSVRTSMAPGAGNSVTITLRANGADTGVSCTISETATTCSSTATALVGAGSALALKISSSPATPAMSLLVGFEGT